MARRTNPPGDIVVAIGKRSHEGYSGIYTEYKVRAFFDNGTPIPYTDNFFWSKTDARKYAKAVANKLTRLKVASTAEVIDATTGWETTKRKAGKIGKASKAKTVYMELTPNWGSRGFYNRGIKVKFDVFTGQGTRKKSLFTYTTPKAQTFDRADEMLRFYQLMLTQEGWWGPGFSTVKYREKYSDHWGEWRTSRSKGGPFWLSALPQKSRQYRDDDEPSWTQANYNNFMKEAFRRVKQRMPLRRTTKPAYHGYGTETYYKSPLDTKTQQKKVETEYARIVAEARRRRDAGRTDLYDKTPLRTRPRKQEKQVVKSKTYHG